MGKLIIAAKEIVCQGCSVKVRTDTAPSEYKGSAQASKQRKSWKGNMRWRLRMNL